MDAIARFEMPEECYQCPCCGGNMHCRLFFSRKVPEERIPEWCPLEEDED